MFEPHSQLSNEMIRLNSTFIFKRGIDILFSLIALLVFGPLLIIIALLVKLTSKGPILFKQKRLGYGNKEFVFLKFRSMTTELKGQEKHDLLKGEGKLYKDKNDIRITAVGKFIRKTSLDELPQLINVLKGEMSIVGPRPLIPFMLDNYPEFRKTRGTVKPGITGLWQINDRENNTDAKFMIGHDTEYIRNHSILLDFQIIFKTIGVVLSTKGAY